MFEGFPIDTGEVKSGECIRTQIVGNIQLETANVCKNNSGKLEKCSNPGSTSATKDDCKYHPAIGRDNRYVQIWTDVDDKEYKNILTSGKCNNCQKVCSDTNNKDRTNCGNENYMGYSYTGENLVVGKPLHEGGETMCYLNGKWSQDYCRLTDNEKKCKIYNKNDLRAPEQESMKKMRESSDD